MCVAFVTKIDHTFIYACRAVDCLQVNRYKHGDDVKVCAYPTNFTYKTNQLPASSAVDKNTRSCTSSFAVVTCTGKILRS
jgi:hypothetical protein